MISRMKVNHNHINLIALIFTFFLAKELISALLIVDPFKRATVSDALEMPWMKLNVRTQKKKG